MKPQPLLGDAAGSTLTNGRHLPACELPRQSLGMRDALLELHAARRGDEAAGAAGELGDAARAAELLQEGVEESRRQRCCAQLRAETLELPLLVLVCLWQGGSPDDVLRDATERAVERGASNEAARPAALTATCASSFNEPAGRSAAQGGLEMLYDGYNEVAPCQQNSARLSRSMS